MPEKHDRKSIKNLTIFDPVTNGLQLCCCSQLRSLKNETKIIKSVRLAFTANGRLGHFLCDRIAILDRKMFCSSCLSMKRLKRPRRDTSCDYRRHLVVDFNGFFGHIE